jgi:hypothetical protein
MVNSNVAADLVDMEKRLNTYVNNGRVAAQIEIREEPMASVKPDVLKIRPLKKTNNFSGDFVAVDCSTRTLKRANNWGIYLMRTTCALVRKRNVDWNYLERLYTAVGDSRTRSNFLTDVRIELESQMALKFLEGEDGFSYYEHTDPRSNYLLLDGGGYFGGERKFRVWLYEKCEKTGINLLAISKNSPSLHDEKGRDFIATTSTLAPHGIWMYHPVRKADKDRSLYGDVALVKLCEENPRVFRCDIMEYLTNQELSEVLSPLTAVAEDPRCLGYPIPLWLAHEFSAPSDSMLLSYLDQIEETLKNAGLLEALRREERSCSFADELHGIKHAFEWEWWDGQF